MTTDAPQVPPMQTPITGSKVINAVLVWKLAIFELCIICAITAGTFYLSGTGDEEWDQMSGPAKMRFKVGMTLSVLQLIRSFMSTTVATLRKGGTLPPDPDGNGNGNTAFIQRKVTQTDSVTVQTTPDAAKGAGNPPV